MLKSGKFWKESFSKPTLSSAREGRECGRRNFMKFLLFVPFILSEIVCSSKSTIQLPKAVDQKLSENLQIQNTNSFFFFFFAKYCSCNCLKIKMTFEVPYSGIKPICISSMSTCCLTNFSIIHSAIFRI